MKRYIFLLIAFFLILSAHAEGIGISNSLGNINATPTGLTHEEGVIVKGNNDINKSFPKVSCQGHRGKGLRHGEAVINNCIRTTKTNRAKKREKLHN